MLYAVIYGYVGISVVIVDLIHRQTFFIFAYFIVTSLIVIGLIFKMSRDFKEVK
jgi:Ca2+/Na+ antiporter